MVAEGFLKERRHRFLLLLILRDRFALTLLSCRAVVFNRCAENELRRALFRTSIRSLDTKEHNA